MTKRALSVAAFIICELTQGELPRLDEADDDPGEEGDRVVDRIRYPA